MKFLFRAVAVVLFLSTQLLGQAWNWLEKPEVLNPSGIKVPDNQTFFQVLDWNQDGRWDIIQNNSGTLELFLQAFELGQFYIDNSVHFPRIGLYPISPQYPEFKLPKNFEFIDWDSDGDFDLAADSSLFWWNNGTNLNPIWTKNDSLFAGVGIGKDFSFADIDQDNDWDFIFQELWSGYPFLFINSSNNTEPTWQLSDTLYNRVFGFFGQKFINLNNDSLIDLTAVGYIPADPGTHLSLHFLKNEGTLNNPQWQGVEERSFFWSAFTGGQPAYDFFDFNKDGHFDIIKNDWMRHVFIYLNQSQNQLPVFSNTPDFVYGAINGESKVRPYFFDTDKDGLQDLMVFEDFWTFFNFGCYYYHESRNRVYKNLNGQFQTNREIFNNIPRSYNTTFPATFLRGLTISFADVDSDNDVDFISGYIKVDCSDSVVAKGILFFEDASIDSNSNWQRDTTKFNYFSSPDSMFYDPHLIDIDEDGDYDIFLQKNGAYQFYEKLNTPDEPWQRNTNWETGIENPIHYSAAFADLNLDGLQDLVFGEMNGTLTFYENIGVRNQPQWKVNESAFASIDVDSLAVPAFSDLSADGKPDLVVGNFTGQLFYFENATIVDNVNEPSPRPGEFILSQNYPNPFNPETTIKFNISSSGFVKLAVYNILGELVRKLLTAELIPGEYGAIWDGKNERGISVSSGIYIYKLQAGRFIRSQKMVLLR